MKILLFTLFLLTFVHGKSVSLLLPQQYDTVIYELNRHLLNANIHVKILTPHFQNADIKKTVLSLLQNNIPITLVTNSQNNMGSNLVQFKNIDFHLLKNMKLTFSMFIIDDKFTCKLSSALDKESMKSNVSFFECNSANYMLEDANKIFNSVTSRAKPYLKEDF